MMALVITLNHLGQHQEAQNTTCPRCGDLMPGKTTRHALSRYANIQVCGICSNLKAMEVAGLIEKVPLKEWAIFPKRRDLDVKTQRERFFEMSDDPDKMREAFSAAQLREDMDQNMTIGQNDAEDLEHWIEKETQKTTSLSNALLEITENLWMTTEDGTEQELSTLREINRLLEMAVEKAKEMGR